MKIYFIQLILLLLISPIIVGQSFTHEAIINKVSKDSIYKIPLSPDQKRFMSTDLHDMRIYDNHQTEIPYVLLKESLLKSKSDFVEYKIISQKHFKSYSEIIIHNPNKDKISNIAFNINNSDAYKYCSIEGSDDMKQWYSVSASQELSLMYNDIYTNSYKCIYFPLNNYTYFRLLADDWNSEPLKINSAGYFKNSVISGKLNEVSFTKSIINDVKTKTTTIHLSLSNNQQIDRIDFKIKAPRLYKRHAIIYVNKDHKIKNITKTYRETIFEFDLSSDATLWFDIPQLNEQEFFIEIENKDNPPLELESITCKQLASYIVCDLKANNTYTLLCGDNTLKLPEYDLFNFVSQIPQLLPETVLDSIKEIKKENKTVELKQEKSFFETKQFLWLCLGLGAIIIFLFSRSLLKDMGKKD